MCIFTLGLLLPHVVWEDGIRVVCVCVCVKVRARLCARAAGIDIPRAAPAEANVFKVSGPQQPSRCTWGAGHRGRMRERGAQEQSREEEER